MGQMTTGGSKYLLFKRPQNDAKMPIFGKIAGGTTAESVYTKKTGVLTYTHADFIAITEGDPWILITVSNSLTEVVEKAKLISGTFGISNVMICRRIELTTKTTIE